MVVVDTVVACHLNSQVMEMVDTIHMEDSPRISNNSNNHNIQEVDSHRILEPIQIKEAIQVKVLHIQEVVVVQVIHNHHNMDSLEDHSPGDIHHNSLNNHNNNTINHPIHNNKTTNKEVNKWVVVVDSSRTRDTDNQ